MNTRQWTGKLQDWQKRAGERARSCGKATDRYVHDHAWSSLGAAALFGCMVGCLLANRGER